MDNKSKKYLSKRSKIVTLIENTRFDWETEDCIHTVCMTGYEATELATKILSELGINKPREIKENNGMWYS